MPQERSSDSSFSACVLWLVARAPLGPALGLQPLFSPATFFRPLLGPLSASAGVLALSGILLTMAGIWLWRRRLPRRWYGVLFGAILLLASPYLIRALGRGITPPARGVSVGAVAHLAADAPGRGVGADCPGRIAVSGERARESHPLANHRWCGYRLRRRRDRDVRLESAEEPGPIGTPSSGRRRCCWSPCPRRRWATISGIALVAGSSAALVTWGAEMSGRLQVAQRDMARLGDEPDPLAVPLLERFGEQAWRARPPANASEMYALWHGSSLEDQGYPAHLALWSPSGELRDELTLDSAGCARLSCWRPRSVVSPRTTAFG